jgi:hypothetical protein
LRVPPTSDTTLRPYTQPGRSQGIAAARRREGREANDLTASKRRIAGVGVTLIFSLAILCASRFVDLSRDGRGAEAIAFGVLALVAVVAALAAAVGIIVRSQK